MDNLETRKTLDLKLLPAGEDFSALEGENLLHAMSKAGIGVPSDCGGRGKCGKCRVRILRREVPPTAIEAKLLSKKDLESGVRLACQVLVSDSLAVELLQDRGLDHQKWIDSEAVDGLELKPWARAVEIPGEVLESSIVEERTRILAKKLNLRGESSIELGAVRELARKDFAARRNRVVLRGDGQVMGFLASGPKGPMGMALDIGTTSMAAALVDLDSGLILAQTTRLNPQAGYGADVVSRINYCMEHDDGLETLREAVLRAADSMIREMADSARVPARDIFHIIVVGNTPMNHIFMGIDPRSLGHAPYIGAFRELGAVSAMEAGLNSAPGAVIELVPNIFSFVGADTVGVILETDLDAGTGARLAIDLGTNGEVALAANGKLWVTSTAAGCAFEGAQITCGMRACEGAAARVRLPDSGEIELETIGETRPVGICGSGLIDAVGELLRVGMLDNRGRFPRQRDTRSGSNWIRYIIEEDKRLGFMLQEKPRITIWERDIAQLQLAKAAVFAGVEALLKLAGLKPGDLEALYVAGSFGNYLDTENALRIGLLPPVAPDKVRLVGNAALRGAIKALVNRDYLLRARRIASAADHVELGNMSEFRSGYLAAMSF